jgi:hypothetical protein
LHEHRRQTFRLFRSCFSLGLLALLGLAFFGLAFRLTVAFLGVSVVVIRLLVIARLPTAMIGLDLRWKGNRQRQHHHCQRGRTPK